MRKVVTEIRRLKNEEHQATFRVHTIDNATIDEIKNDPEIKSLFGEDCFITPTSIENVFLLKTSLRITV